MMNGGSLSDLLITDRNMYTCLSDLDGSKGTVHCSAVGLVFPTDRFVRFLNERK
jgi:hypothetical protein